MSFLTLDEKELIVLKEDAVGFALDQKAEDSLCRLLDLQTKVNEYVEQVKQAIAEKALEYDADFTSISGDKVKLEYRQFGSEFSIKDQDKVPEAFMTKTERVAVNAEAVRAFMKTTGQLPDGIIQNERKKTLVIKRKEN
jgi:hypothetical protein